MEIAIIGAGKWGLAVDRTLREQSPLSYADAVSSSAEGSRDVSLECLRSDDRKAKGNIQ